MKLPLVTTAKTEKGSLELPSQFSETVRPDLISRAVIAIQQGRRQPYGADPEAGKKHSSKLSRRRRDFKGSYGHGISRVPRKIISRNGTQFNWVGAFAPQTVGGRRAHPPKAEKIFARKINKKEDMKAVRSALAATVLKEAVVRRGHIIPKEFPFIVEDKIEKISKAKELKAVLEKLGFEKELERISKKKIRAGKGKMRGRKYKRIRGMLIVTSENCPLVKASSNIPGIECIPVKMLDAEMLAPGTSLGRLTIYTSSAIEKMKNDSLFTENAKKSKTEKKAEK